MISTTLFLYFFILLHPPSIFAHAKNEPPENCSAPGYPPPSRAKLGPPFSSDEVQEAREAGLERHNFYRAKHGATNLARKVNEDKIDLLGELAMHAAGCMVQWEAALRTQDGESIFYLAQNTKSHDDTVKGFNITSAAIHAVEKWYEEYCTVLDARVSGTGTRHFTQLVWKRTKLLGMGFARSFDNNDLFVVARYDEKTYHGQERTQIGKLSKKEDSEICCRKEKMFLSRVKKGTDCDVGAATNIKGTMVIIYLCLIPFLGGYF